MTLCPPPFLMSFWVHIFFNSDLITASSFGLVAQRKIHGLIPPSRSLVLSLSPDFGTGYLTDTIIPLQNRAMFHERSPPLALSSSRRWSHHYCCHVSCSQEVADCWVPGINQSIQVWLISVFMSASDEKCNPPWNAAGRGVGGVKRKETGMRLARDPVRKREGTRRMWRLETWRWLPKSRWAAVSRGRAVHISLRKQHAWGAHTSKSEAQAGQEPSGHALPITQLASTCNSVYLPTYFPFFKSKVQFRQEPKQAKRSNYKNNENRPLFFGVFSPEKLHTHMLPTAPAPQRDSPTLERGCDPPRLPMRNQHSSRDPKSSEFLNKWPLVGIHCWHEETVSWPWPLPNCIPLIQWMSLSNPNPKPNIKFVTEKHKLKNVFHIFLLAVAQRTCQRFSIPHFPMHHSSSSKSLQNMKSEGKWNKRTEGKPNNRWIALSLKWESPPSIPPSTSSSSLPPSTVVPVLWGKGLNGSAGLNHVLRHGLQLNSAQCSNAPP